MNLDDIAHLAREENDFVERKEGLGDAVGRAIASFGTSSGGKILIGVSDSGQLIGVDYGDSIRKKMNEIESKCKNTPNIIIDVIPFEKGKAIICLSVDESNIKPTYFNGMPYRRINRENKVCTNDEVLHYQVETGQIKFDSTVAKNSERKALLQDVDSEKLTTFIEMAKGKRNRVFGQSQRIEDTLSNLNIFNRNSNEILNAGILIFGKKPQEFIKNSTISFSAFSGNEVSDTFSKQSITGDIFAQVEITTNLIRQFSPPISRVQGLKRIDTAPYPYEALRELIINAIVHRDYFIDSEITIRLFSNRIEITNPGGVPTGIDYETLVQGQNNLSVRRNPLLAEILDYAGYMEKAGYGFNRVLSILQKYGSPKPEFPKIDGCFKAIVYAGGPDSPITKSTELDYAKGKLKILEIILSNGPAGITNKKLLEKAEYSAVYVSNITTELEDEGQITKKKSGKEVFLYPYIK